MSTLAAYLRHLFTRQTVLFECRNCGETLERDVAACPGCGSAEIAEYELLE